MIKPGNVVRFIGATEAQIRWGSNDDPKGILKLRGLYTVDKVEVHSWHTKIYLKEFPKYKFNSACFEKLEHYSHL